MKLYLVRHAQTLWNRDNRLQGYSDTPLSPAGVAQAASVGAYFARQPIAALYTSHLPRTIRTAEPIARALGCAPQAEPALGEIGLGDWEGLTPEEINTRYAGAFERWRSTPSTTVIPGGEPLAAFRERVRKGIERIMARHQSGPVVVVTHGGVISALLADWLEASYDHLLRRLVLDNGGISALNIRALPPDVLWVNATHHLPVTVASVGQIASGAESPQAASSSAG
ncbi:MAG: histidine phosphatase family protein [Candidatus Omnitrophica bacterium]|nr:histidine phosphatase family protein [Candidatus Omnitrophota bacterium]